ncbi:MAG: MFS transporter, partial [Deltaproteobacteria bacterium]|nr:MFS transporter [Deltaproteobacteria bacterium]
MFRPHEITTEFGRRMYLFLFVLTFASTVAFQAWSILCANFAVDVVGLSAAQFGIIHSVREVPGLLTALVIALLYLVREETLAAFAVLALGLGVLLTGMFPSYGGMLLTTLLLSTGFHFFEANNQSLILQAYDARVTPLVMGRLRGLTAGGNLLAGVCILGCSPFLGFPQMYLVVGGLAFCAALYALSRRPDCSSLPRQRAGIVLKRRYWLFYALTVLAGARRQIFTVFSVLLLVERFEYSITEISVLFIINNALNWFLNPLIGKAINMWGERRLLTLEYVAVLGIFSGYALLDNHLLICVLYVIDQVVYNFAIAVRTFFQKIAAPEDIAPSMAVSVTINHFAAVGVPAVGGMLWLVEYSIPFWMGAGLALVSLLLVQYIDRELRGACAA